SACIEKIQEIISNRAFSKVKKIITGGRERYQSSLAAINSCTPAEGEEIRLIFHDAVRPLVSNRIIEDVVHALDHYKAVDVVVPTTDTIISADPITNTIASVPPRQTLRNGQTPQAFHWKTIKDAYDIALKDAHFQTTDDCGVVLKYLPDEKIFLVPGEHNNVKLTYKDDLQIIDKLLQLNTKKIICNNLDSRTLSALKNKVLVVMGGTSGIGAEIATIANAYQAKVVSASRRTGTDVTDLESLKRTLREVHDTYGRVDYVVNAAGILAKQPLVLMEYKEVLEAIRINYIGAVHVALASYEYLKESKGHLLNFTSSSYTYGRAYYSLYSSSKAAIVNLTQALAEEWHTQYIRINCINPERTNTPMRQRAFGIEPENSLLSPKSVALLSLGVLLSNETGQILDITTQFAKTAIATDLYSDELVEYK
ncbi:MAG: SDR family NAD(P)-dependent oxidoreductase, partial [Chitinophagaceae bacterium]|nr:SDR family NAD(P)-dependent oxidoreductase [Chitinophagaceae bacterium]